MITRTAITLGGIFAALGVIMGAMAAHMLKERLDPGHLEMVKVGAQYQIYHGIALILVGVVGRMSTSRLLSASGWLFLVGIFLFSGCLYLAALLPAGIGPLMMLVPLGGTAQIIAWLLLAAHGWKSHRNT